MLLVLCGSFWRNSSRSFGQCIWEWLPPRKNYIVLSHRPLAGNNFGFGLSETEALGAIGVPVYPMVC